jgi:glucose/arabinose dehydrogenase
MRIRLPVLVLAFGGWVLPAWSSLAVEQPVGQSFHVDPRALPAPGATPSAANPPRIIARPAAALPQVPPGFTANLFAEGLDNPRQLVVAPNGDVLVAESRANRIALLRDADGDGRAETRVVLADGFDRPFGMVVRPDGLWVADVDAVWRLDYTPGDTKAGARHRITAKGALDGGNGHWTRNLAFDPSGSHFYVAIGSAGNLGEEPAPRATIQQFRADGGGQRTFASGLRNPVGLAFRPGTGELWTVVNERDGLGDGLVPDYLTRVREGGFYGWPYSYIGGHPQPGYAGRAPDKVARAIVPDLLLRSHSAPLGLAFYTGDRFPPEYRGDAFIGLHGSWNAADPQGYMVARVPFRDGRPTGSYQSFATGFWAKGESRAEVWGRPVGIAVAGDGSLLVADDVGQVVWRIAWRGERATPP